MTTPLLKPLPSRPARHALAAALALAASIQPAFADPPAPATPDATVFSGLPAAEPPTDATSATSGWSLSLGLGVGNGPVYAGSATRRTAPMPYASIAYKDRFTVTPAGLMFNVAKGTDWKVNVGLSGDSLNRKDSHNEQIKQLPNRHFARANISGSYTLGGTVFSARLATTVSNNKGGSELTLSAQRTLYAGDSFTLGMGGQISFGNGQFMQTTYGITGQQSADSSLREFTPKSGLHRAGVSTVATYAIDQHWTLLGTLNVGRLQGDAAKSPFTEKKNYANAILGIGYRF